MTETNRTKALEFALRHPSYPVNAQDVVENATVYLGFLNGDTVAEVEPTFVYYKRRVNGRDLYRVPTRDYDPDAKAEYLAYSGTWRTAVVTTVADVLTSVSEGETERVAQP